MLIRALKKKYKFHLKKLLNGLKITTIEVTHDPYEAFLSGIKMGK
jgi:ABC-type spermidine/putrescine transport systems, ATPase components